MERLVRVAWGPRQESVEAVAGRWKQTLDGLAALLPDAGSGTETNGLWTWQHVHVSGPATELRPDGESLLTALRAEQEADGWSDRTGYGLALVIEGKPGWKIDITSRAGGSPEFLLQTMGIRITSPDEVATPDAELLTALVEAWDPDYGGAFDDDLLDALEDDAGFVVGEPSVGWIGHLSARRAALVPDDLPAARRELPGGGVVLGIAPQDDTEAVVQAYVRLRDAGALAPLPRPMDRPHL
ncbi:hypothetical protein [Streptomyces solicathayae]|uniref:Immunity protein 52 domain-containing protein n=1 Tax=Streptomyces solicathayae TaxID=3081768 RepID=A0ABZ0LTY7_9ACTN|nr:hypothetical protein [Streptomyces sp. HUAS YS2]WOX22800.1 hypothetical protein R2D22_15895 [Streptomyces sp. HUAS YS2]